MQTEAKHMQVIDEQCITYKFSGPGKYQETSQLM